MNLNFLLIESSTQIINCCFSQPRVTDRSPTPQRSEHHSPIQSNVQGPPAHDSVPPPRGIVMRQGKIKIGTNAATTEFDIKVYGKFKVTYGKLRPMPLASNP